ncbi:MAG: hypothetical protein ACO1SV_22075 [Fimbriimonas sp.]
MKTPFTLRLTALAGIATLAATGFADSGTYGCTFGGLTGLYTGNGGQLTSSVSYVNCAYTLEYNSAQTPTSVTFSSPSNIWPTTLKITFNSSAWQSYRYSGVNFAVQVCNYIITQPPGGTTSVSRVDEFWGPNASLLWWNNGFHAVTTYATVNPRQFNLSEFDVDPMDLSGKTAVKRWHASSSPPYPYPWQNAPTTTVVYPGNHQTFAAVVQAYPKLNQDVCGVSFVDGGGVPAYPIAPIPSASKLSPTQDPNSLAARAFRI